MYHLGACVGFLIVVGHCHAVELPIGIVSLQNAARILPCDGRACLDLCPADLREIACTESTLGHKVIDTSLAVLVAWIPVLDSRILDFCTVVDIDLDYSGMQLILVAHWSRTAFEI